MKLKIAIILILSGMALGSIMTLFYTAIQKQNLSNSTQIERTEP